MVVERTPGAGLDVVCDVAPGADNLAAKLYPGARRAAGPLVRGPRDHRGACRRGGGLGGGSSDAAATLLAVERLFSLELSQKVRYDVAAAVGSDVPFFLWPGPQLAMGRGQVLKDVALPALHLVVAMPDIGLSTAAVYRWRDEDAEGRSRSSRRGRGCCRARPKAAETVKDVAALVANDLEPSVVARKEKVGELLERLRSAGALTAAMTGSGAAVFGVFASEEKALAARAAVAPARAWYVTDLQPGAPRRAPAKGRGKAPA